MRYHRNIDEMCCAIGGHQGTHKDSELGRRCAVGNKCTVHFDRTVVRPMKWTQRLIFNIRLLLTEHDTHGSWTMQSRGVDGPLPHHLSPLPEGWGEAGTQNVASRSTFPSRSSTALQ